MKEEFNLNAVYLLMKYAKEYSHKKIRGDGCSATEHLICTFLYYHTGVSQDTVAESLAIDKTTVAKALVTLEKKGLVVRKKNDDNHRKKCLELTAEGRIPIRDNLKLYDEWTTYLTAELSAEEKAAFYSISNKICERAKKINDETD